MANILGDDKKDQILALGRLGWPLRRIEQATGVRRETASAYLKAAGIAVRPPGGWGRRAPAKPANEVTTEPSLSKPAIEVTTDFYRGKVANEATTDPDPSKPAIEVTTDFDGEKPASEATTDSHPPNKRLVSACEPYREVIQSGLNLGRNAMAIWQEIGRAH